VQISITVDDPGRITTMIRGRETQGRWEAHGGRGSDRRRAVQREQHRFHFSQSLNTRRRDGRHKAGFMGHKQGPRENKVENFHVRIRPIGRVESLLGWGNAGRIWSAPGRRRFRPTPCRAKTTGALPISAPDAAPPGFPTRPPADDFLPPGSAGPDGPCRAKDRPYVPNVEAYSRGLMDSGFLFSVFSFGASQSDPAAPGANRKG